MSPPRQFLSLGRSFLLLIIASADNSHLCKWMIRKSFLKASSGATLSFFVPSPLHHLVSNVFASCSPAVDRPYSHRDSVYLGCVDIPSCEYPERALLLSGRLMQVTRNPASDICAPELRTRKGGFTGLEMGKDSSPNPTSAHSKEITTGNNVQSACLQDCQSQIDSLHKALQFAGTIRQRERKALNQAHRTIANLEQRLEACSISTRK